MKYLASRISCNSPCGLHVAHVVTHWLWYGALITSINEESLVRMRGLVVIVI